MSQETRGSVPGASGKHSRRRRVEDDLRAQWRVVCSESSDSNDEQSCTRERMKHHKSPSLLPVVSAGCEPCSVDAGTTEEHAETAEGGSPVVRVARRPESVTNTKLTPWVKAREFDGSFCIDDYIVHFDRVGHINEWSDG